MWIDIPKDNKGLRAIYEERQYSWTKSARESDEPTELALVFSVMPDPKAWVPFNAFGMEGSGLGRYREELISTSISALLHCKM